MLVFSFLCRNACFLWWGIPSISLFPIISEEFCVVLFLKWTVRQWCQVCCISSYHFPLFLPSVEINRRGVLEWQMHCSLLDRHSSLDLSCASLLVGFPCHTGYSHIPSFILKILTVNMCVNWTYIVAGVCFLEWDQNTGRDCLRCAYSRLVINLCLYVIKQRLQLRQL